MITIADNGVFILENAGFKRQMQFDVNGLQTVSVLNKTNGREYVRRQAVPEFSFCLNDQLISSYVKEEISIVDGNRHSASVRLELSANRVESQPDGAETLELAFDIRELEAKVSVFYRIYPDLSGCVKWLKITSTGDDLRLNKLSLELLNLGAGELLDQEYYRGQGTQHAMPMFTATGTDDMVQVHNPCLNEGFWVGLAIPLPLCYFMCYPQWSSGIVCGYSQNTPEFNQYLAPGESFTSGQVLLMIYQGVRTAAGVRNGFRELIRRVLPVYPDKSGIMYCTWLPFLKNINAALVEELAEHAAGLGFQTLVVDDGWFTNDRWAVDREKFPHGLEAVSARVKALGLEFGLWFNIGNDYGSPGSYPGNNCRLENGYPKLLGVGGYRCRCQASNHLEVATRQLTELAQQYGVDYFKLDFSNIVSPYGIIPAGCSAQNHPHHRDASDAVAEQYRSLYCLRENVKSQFPRLVVDFSFESFGTETPGIAALQYSELHHVSNLNTNSPVFNARKIRITLYRFAAVLPPERLLGSLICLQNRDDLENLYTALVGAPLVAGDLRAILPENRQMLDIVSRAWRELVADGPLTNFVSWTGDAPEGPMQWDGFARYSTDGRGFIGLFANESKAGELPVAIDDLSSGEYGLSDMLTGEALGTYSAGQLAAGIRISLGGQKFRGIRMYQV